MKIAFFSVYKDQIKFLKSHFEAYSEFELLFFETSEVKQNLDKIRDIEVLSVFCNNKVDKEVVNSLNKLKLIATRSTGFDHIDCDYAKQKGVAVCNVPEYGSSTVAEYTFAMLLNITRKVYKFSERTDRGEYFYKDLRGTDLYGKTIGVVGAGNIGQRVIQIATGFGMRVLVFDQFADKKLASKLGFDYVETLDILLSKSDIITLHVPYNSTTHHLINEGNITKVKKGAILLNTARGSVVSNKAVAKGLKMGIISYAGLDVIEKEDELLTGKGDKLAKQLAELEEVVYSPHVAYYTKGAEERILQATIDNITSFVGGDLMNVVK